MARRTFFSATMFFLLVLGGVSGFSQDIPNTPYFSNIASEVGIHEIPAGRAVWTDIDGNGYPDVVLEKYMVFRSMSDPDLPGGRRFEDITGAGGLQVFRDGENGREERPVNVLIFGDVDNDGDQDAYSAVYCDFLKPKADPVTGDFMVDENGNVIFEVPDQGWRSEIFINNGLGRFEILEDSGVDSNPATTCAAAFLDCDKDGMLDLF
ncbi:MAG: hypothetical protein NTY09_13825, partial [bacterium]|nr:hypothetical protein [bacterium]